MFLGELFGDLGDPCGSHTLRQNCRIMNCPGLPLYTHLFLLSPARTAPAALHAATQAESSRRQGLALLPSWTWPWATCRLLPAWVLSESSRTQPLCVMQAVNALQGRPDSKELSWWRNISLFNSYVGSCDFSFTQLLTRSYRVIYCPQRCPN